MNEIQKNLVIASISGAGLVASFLLMVEGFNLIIAKDYPIGFFISALGLGLTYSLYVTIDNQWRKYK